MANSCVFCDIVNGEAPAEIVHDWGTAIAIRPLHPVTPGHMLVIPKQHVADSSEDLQVTGMTAVFAADLASEWTKNGDYNLIVNCGSAASKTQFHLHWHVVPRCEGDGLALPWTGQVKT